MDRERSLSAWQYEGNEGGHTMTETNAEHDPCTAWTIAQVAGPTEKSQHIPAAGARRPSSSLGICDQCRPGRAGATHCQHTRVTLQTGRVWRKAGLSEAQ